MNDERLYEDFMLLISKYNNKALLKLADSLIEYVKNDEEEE